jgi:hypothetical protein
MPAPRVSIIVPIHEGAGLLRSSLRSILRQTYDDFEVIVAGDGAGEEVRRETLATGDPRVRWEGFPKAPGIGYSNRARAIGIAKGELIAYLAPDDLWAPLDAGARLGPARLRVLETVLVWGSESRVRTTCPSTGEEARARLDSCSPAFRPRRCSTEEIHDRRRMDGRPPQHGDVDHGCVPGPGRHRLSSEPTAIRFPSYAFTSGPEGSADALHARFADELDSGGLVLDDLRWPFPRRVLGWGEDVLVVGRSRGPRWAKMLLRRTRG